MRSAQVRYARRGPPRRTAEGMTSRHNILPECGMTDFRDAGRFFSQMWRRLPPLCTVMQFGLMGGQNSFHIIEF